MSEATQDDVAAGVAAADAVDVATALRIAGELIDAGIPVFAAPPCPSGPFGGRGTYVDDGSANALACPRPGHGAGGVEYDLPAKWQQTVPSRVWLEKWRPGWALAAVGGWAADFLDIDPRNGGNVSFAEMSLAGQVANYYGVQETPSGGQHHLISPTGERKSVGFLPGLDLQAGAADGQGRGFVWIAPTVKRSKTDGEVRAYRWTQEPDLDWLAEFSRDPVTGVSADGSIAGLLSRVASARMRRADGMRERRTRDGSRAREFTPAQMLEFLAPQVERVEKAQIGEIEEQANALACALSHFVPSMLSEDQAYGLLLDALGETAYDPAHPASGWEASKFIAVISDVGGRAPGDWHAVPGADQPARMDAGALQEAVAGVDVAGDEVSALLAEMLTADELAEREPPRFLIEGMLQYDSEAWVIGEPGSKKSFVVLDMAACVATGRPWQGHRVNPALVVFIVAEGAGGSSARVKAWQKEYGQMGECIRFLPRPIQSADVQAWAVLVQACARLAGVARGMNRGLLVVLDTQARVTVGLKENDATDMGVFIDAIGAIRAAADGACVLTIHHTGRRGGDARGSSAIDGAQTTELKVIKKGELEGQVITEKQKDIAEADPIDIRFEVVDLGQDCDGRPVSSLVLLPKDSWRSGEVDDETVRRAEQEEALELSPFTVRSVPQEWTHRLTSSRAVVDRWLLQALADVAQDYGLTKKEWLDQVAGKLHAGQTYVQARVNWEKNFQRVSDSTGPAGVAGIVVKVNGAGRWTVDQVALTAFQNEDKTGS